MNPTQIKEARRLHEMWVKGVEGGVRADLSGAYLSDVNLSHASLYRANLSGANLSDVNLYRANLSDAGGIVSFGPVGRGRRIGYATSAGVQLGCFWGSLEEACAALKKKYGPNSTYEALVRAAVATLED